MTTVSWLLACWLCLDTGIVLGAWMFGGRHDELTGADVEVREEGTNDVRVHSK